MIDHKSYYRDLANKRREDDPEYVKKHNELNRKWYHEHKEELKSRREIDYQNKVCKSVLTSIQQLCSDNSHYTNKINLQIDFLVDECVRHLQRKTEDGKCTVYHLATLARKPKSVCSVVVCHMLNLHVGFDEGKTLADISKVVGISESALQGTQKTYKRVLQAVQSGRETELNEYKALLEQRLVSNKNSSNHELLHLSSDSMDDKAHIAKEWLRGFLPDDHKKTLLVVCVDHENVKVHNIPSLILD